MLTHGVVQAYYLKATLRTTENVHHPISSLTTQNESYKAVLEVLLVDLIFSSMGLFFIPSLCLIILLINNFNNNFLIYLSFVFLFLLIYIIVVNRNKLVNLIRKSFFFKKNYSVNFSYKWKQNIFFSFSSQILRVFSVYCLLIFSHDYSLQNTVLVLFLISTGIFFSKFGLLAGLGLGNIIFEKLFLFLPNVTEHLTAVFPSKKGSNIFNIFWTINMLISLPGLLIYLRSKTSTRKKYEV